MLLVGNVQFVLFFNPFQKTWIKAKFKLGMRNSNMDYRANCFFFLYFLRWCCNCGLSGGGHEEIEWGQFS